VKFATALVVVAMAFAWLLSYRLSNLAVGDKRFGAVVDATAPRYFSGIESLQGGRLLANQFRSAMGGPPGEIQVDGARYVSFSSCEAHDCLLKAMLWVDLETGASIGAIGVESFDSRRHASIAPLLFSKTVDCRSLPPPFEQALASWVGGEQVTVAGRTFVGRGARVAKECA
jgi:hypothetical protein